MRRIIVLNPKGGCGKTTLATNLASRYAAAGYGTALYDYDPQGSSSCWHSLRTAERPPIHGVSAFQASGFNITRSWALRLPPGTNRMVIDTPAALNEPELREHIRNADAILVPVQPSPIDLHAAMRFIRLLRKIVQQAPIGVVANRVGEGVRLDKLEEYLAELGLPLVTRLPDCSRYSVAFEQGLGVHELPEVDSLKAGWQDLLDWLEAGEALPLDTPAQAY